MSEPEKEILPAFIHWTFFETIDEDLLRLFTLSRI
jgi:hypothetical protein